MFLVPACFRHKLYIKTADVDHSLDAARARVCTICAVVRLSRLRALRERRVLTQQELAQKAGITRATLSRLEGGADNPYPSTIRKLAAALEVDPQALMEPEDR